MKIQYLNWDTEFFGLKIGKIEIFDENNFDPEKFKKQALDEKYELVYAFKYGEMLPMQKISNASLELVDIMLSMSKKFDKADFIDIPYDFRNELSKGELEDCYYIAEQTSIVSRFYNEPKIGPIKTKELYRRWIDNALNKSYSDGLFILKEHHKVVGFNLIKTDETEKIGYCSLIGVNPKTKGQGIGKKLWLQSCGYWSNEKQINNCKVPFSFKNSQSFNFHLKIGFNKIEETKYIYHFRNTFI